MKKTLLFISQILLFAFSSFSQQNYDDFEGNKFQYFGNINGQLDSSFINPAPDTINNSALSAQYIRSDTVQYDNFKMYPFNKLVDVTPYATTFGAPPKIKMKLYTTAPIGTVVELQLGIKGDNNYPSGVHSVYKDTTKAQYQWEELIFDFYQIPSGALVGPTNVDKITLFFSPQTFSGDTFYFDDLTGPDLFSPINIEVENARKNPYLKQNFPNPAIDKTTINYRLEHSGHVSLKLFNAIGVQVLNLVDRVQLQGEYKIVLNADDFADIAAGTYFYTIMVGEFIETRKMTVLKL